MSSPEETMVAHLLADTGLSALISARVYPVTLPQNGTLPAVTYSKVSGIRHVQLDGTPSSAHSRFRLDGWASSYSGVKALEAALMAAMDGLSGAVGAMAPIDFYEDDTGIYRISVDYYLYHLEA